MILDISIWSREPCKPSTTRSGHGCHLCLRYTPSPMSPGRTNAAQWKIDGCARPCSDP
jgi:hypothetical protein